MAAPASTRDMALVTGCSGDIGMAVSRRLAVAGYGVIGWDITTPSTDVPLVGFHRVDLAGDDVSPEAVHQLTVRGQLRYVVHVVGGSDVEELACTDPAQVPLTVFRRTVALNLISAYTVIRATVAALRASSGDRSYTLTSSLNALGGYGAPGYSSAKAGLHGLVGALAGPLIREGIRINAVALGTTRTANYTRLGRLMGKETDFDSIGGRTPRGTVLDPDEAAAALVAIAVANPAITGEVTIADAGQHLAHR